MNMPPNEHDLHAYVDGRLDDDERAAVERYLAHHPERAEQVRQWRLDSQRLRAALANVPLPSGDPTPDPAAIRARRAARTRMRCATAASCVLCIGIGMFGGWQARGWNGASAPVAPMSDAVEAYRLMAIDRDARVDFAPGAPDDLQAWLVKRVGAKMKLPDLTEAGFRPVGGRLFATEHGPAAMVLYEDPAGRTLSFYVRPPESAHRLLAAGKRVDGELLARYGSLQGFNYAVVGPADSLGEKAVATALDEQT